MTKYLILDYETRSEADLRKLGGYEYAKDPSTEIICFAWRLGTRDTLLEAKTHIWSPLLTTGPSVEAYSGMISALLDPTVVIVAHNAGFEYSVTQHVLAGRFLNDHRNLAHQTKDHSRWLCTASLAAALALPRSLEGAAVAFGSSIQKDMAGRKLLLKMCKPRKATKTNSAKWHETPEDIQRLMQYCGTDVDVETELFLVLPPLCDTERKVWELDQKMNFRGFAIDKRLVSTTLKMIEEETGVLNRETRQITKGKLNSVTQRDGVLGWLKDNNVFLPDLQAKTVGDAITSKIADADALRMLEIRQALSKTSTAKYESFSNRARSDGRIRDNLVYHGASTGRWCLPEDAEVLTPSGWVCLKTWNPSQKIIQWSPDGSLSWENFPRKNSFDFFGRFIRIKNSLISFACTAEHRIPYYTHRNKFHTDTAENLFASKLDKMPLSGTLECKNFLPLFTRVLVMVQADGHFILKNGRALRFHFRKKRKIERCCSLLDACKIPYRVSKYSISTVIKISWRDLPEWLKDFSDKNFKPFGYNNFDPKVFIDEIKNWDSHVYKNCKSLEYSTTNYDNALYVQTMAHLSGMSARVVLRSRNIANWNQAYRVYIRPHSKTTIPKDSWGCVDSYGDKIYCPTTSTGFFLCRYQGSIFVSGNSGSGVQPQNFPRGNIADTDLAAKILKQGDLEMVRLLYGNPMDVFSSCLRSVIVASRGKEFFCADYNAIEARGVFWLAKHDAGLKAFASGKDLYRDMATKIFDVPLEEITDKQRFVGKQVILGAGYGLGWKKFKLMCANYGVDIDDDLAQTAIKTYRETHHPVVQLWSNIERAAVAAVDQRKKRFTINRTTWWYEKKFLYCLLPSGRRLAYYGPEIRYDPPRWDPTGEKRAVVYHWGSNPKTKQWEMASTYGGKLVENCVQAVARDIMAEAMLRIEDAGYENLLSVHDEILAERNKREGTLGEFQNLMSTLPAWATGFPLKVSGWVGERYRKG